LLIGNCSFTLCFSTAQNFAGSCGIHGRAFQPSHILPGLQVLWYEEVLQVMIKAALMQADFDPAIRLCMYVTLSLKLLSSYSILSCFLFSLYKPVLAALYALQELYHSQFYTKPCTRQPLAAIYQGSLRMAEYPLQAVLFQGLVMPLLSVPCQTGLSGQDISSLYL
jgi:hypothetical protein